LHKVIAYEERAQNFRRRASEATNSKRKEAEERIAAAWELQARTREKLLKEGAIQPVLSSVFQIDR
jgi:hypothetical protein